MELKRELSLLRDQIQHAGEKESGVDGELIDVKNKVGALSTKEAADAKTLASLQTTMTETRQAMEEVKSSMAALKTSVASASELDNLPRELQSLKKEVATVGSNVASLRDETKKTASSVTELKAEVDALEKKVASNVIGSATVNAMNDSVAEIKSTAEKLTRYELPRPVIPLSLNTNSCSFLTWLGRPFNQYFHILGPSSAMEEEAASMVVLRR